MHDLSLSNLNLLTLKLGQLLLDVRPRLAATDQRLDSIHDLALLGTNLVGRITVSQGDGVVLESLEIDSDAEWCTELVVTAVTLADTGG